MSLFLYKHDPSSSHYILSEVFSVQRTRLLFTIYRATIKQKYGGKISQES